MTSTTLVSPDLYLSITAGEYLREHLFEPAALIAGICKHFHPEVTAENVTAWRQHYRSTAHPGDRAGLTVHQEERDALFNVLAEAEAAGDTRRQILAAASQTTLRAIPSLGAAETMATYSSKGAKLRYWSAQEDARLLAGERVRSGDLDYARRGKLVRMLDYAGLAAEAAATRLDETPGPAPVSDEIADVEVVAEAPETGPRLLVDMRVAGGISLQVEADARHARLVTNGRTYLLSPADVSALAATAAAADRLMGGDPR